jgi:hypothetical protein
VVLRQEATALSRQQLQTVQPIQPAVSPNARARAFKPPAEAQANEPLTLALELDRSVNGAVLEVRHSGEPGFASLPMSYRGGAYWSASLDRDTVRGDRLEYFIEAVGADGKAAPVIGDATAPHHVNLREPVTGEPSKHADATASLFTDYADYNRLRGNDTVWQTEGAFGLRFHDVGLRALRSGFGVFRGVGGSIHDLDDLGKSARVVGLTYGYLEAEAGLSPTVGVIGRGAIGLQDSGITGGAQLFLRIGSDKKTNLLLGGEALGELQWNTFPKVPIVVRTEVSNQPAGSSTDHPTAQDPKAKLGVSSDEGELGARAVVQVGYRIAEPIVVSARASYEGRTIVHAGPGFGAGVTYTW